MGKIFDSLCLKAKKYAEANLGREEYKASIINDIRTLTEQEFFQLLQEEKDFVIDCLCNSIYDNTKDDFQALADVTQFL